MSGITADPHPGGIFETMIVNDHDGSQYTMHAVYVEVVPPERLVWTEPATGVTTTSTFTDLGGARTEVRIRQRNVPDAFRTPDAQAGFARHSTASRPTSPRCDLGAEPPATIRPNARHHPT